MIHFIKLPLIKKILQNHSAISDATLSDLLVNLSKFGDNHATEDDV